MEWKKTPEELLGSFEKKVADTDCEKQKMFGYPCCFINNNMFIGTHGANLVLRLGAADRKKAMAAHGDINVFEPMPGRRMGEYIREATTAFRRWKPSGSDRMETTGSSRWSFIVVPRRVREDDAQFDDLLSRSVKYATSLPPKQKKKRRSK